MSHPDLTFFCELPGDELSTLFDGRFVIDDLLDLDAALSLGILDFSEERAKIVQRLNSAGIKVGICSPLLEQFNQAHIKI